MTEMAVSRGQDVQRTSGGEEARTLLPAVDIFDHGDELVVVADLPGVKKDDIDIRVENNVLTIRGNVQPEDHGGYILREYHLRPYFRQFQLGEHVDQERIRAEMKYGVLTIGLPKAEKAKPKQIQVNVGGE